MIILDVRDLNKGLTLADMEDGFTNTGGQSPTFRYLPDEIWINQWQCDHIFTTIFGQLEYFRGVPLKVINNE